MGDEIVVLTGPRNPDPKAERPGDATKPYEIVRLPRSRRRFWGTIRFVRALTRWMVENGRRFDVVYVSMLKHAAWAAMSGATRARLPVALRAEGGGTTGDVAWQRSARGGGWIQARCRRADAIVAPTAAIADELTGAGYKAERVTVIPNGVQAPREPHDPRECGRHRSALKLENLTTICYAGRVHEGKGLATLLEALKVASPSARPRQLLIVGDGPDRSRLERLAKDLGHDRVVFTGPVDQVEPYLRASELFALPSHAEGMSVALLEAMALGMPALASDIPGNRELAPIDSLPLIPPGDPAAWSRAILKELDSPNPRAGANLRSIVMDRFTIESCALRHQELFATLRRGEGRPE